MIDNPFALGLLELPESPDLGIRHLSAVFRHTTNSYKFYWFLAILELVKNELTQVSVMSLPTRIHIEPPFLAGVEYAPVAVLVPAGP